MNHNNKRFVGTSSFTKCPLGCIYCFVDNPEFIGLPIIKNTGFEIQFQNSAEIEVIQPACDIELFLVKDWETKLEKIAKFGKSVSISTKSKLTKTIIVTLKRINEMLLQSGNILNIAVSITTFSDYWKDIECNAPSPVERLDSLKRLFDNNLPTSVSIRPLYPFLKDNELKKLVEFTYPFTYGYLSGPLYLTEAMKKYLLLNGMSYKVEKKNVEWLPNNPLMEFLSNPTLENTLNTLANEKGLLVFENNVEAVNFIKNKFTK